METFPWEVGEAPASSSSAPVLSTLAAVFVAERSEMHTICSAEDDDDDDVARIGSGYARSLDLRNITKYSSYSKLWRMLYFINDAPFCIREDNGEDMDLLIPGSN